MHDFSIFCYQSFFDFCFLGSRFIPCNVQICPGTWEQEEVGEAGWQPHSQTLAKANRDQHVWYAALGSKLCLIVIPFGRSNIWGCFGATFKACKSHLSVRAKQAGFVGFKVAFVIAFATSVSLFIVCLPGPGQSSLLLGCLQGGNAKGQPKTWILYQPIVCRILSWNLECIKLLRAYDICFFIHVWMAFFEALRKGIPTNWTRPEPGVVSEKQFFDLFPHLQNPVQSSEIQQHVHSYQAQFLRLATNVESSAFSLVSWDSN